jgi:hypothetical protein
MVVRVLLPLGVWTRVGESKYKLNHFAAAWDPTGSTLIGPGNIREEVTLGPGGNKFTGTFTIDQYDESGNKLAHVEGSITGTRIGVNTPPQSIFLSSCKRFGGPITRHSSLFQPQQGFVCVPTLGTTPRGLERL